MYTHIKFFRPSTKSQLLIEAPFEFEENAHQNERFVAWVLENYPDWIPKAYMRKELHGTDD
jgi:hypothetical protein